MRERAKIRKLFALENQISEDQQSQQDSTGSKSMKEEEEENMAN